MDSLNSIDERFISKNELQTQVNNLIINANTLNGFSSTDFSLTNHSHQNEYARTNHADSNNTFGLGSKSLYGHVKVIDNCNSSSYKDGEVLSAYQGKVLKDKIDSDIGSISSWRTVKSDDNYHLYHNSAVGLCWFIYHRNNYNGFNNSVGSNKLHTKIIPNNYLPKISCQSSIYRGDVVVRVDTSGDVYVYSLNKFSSINLYADIMWPII